MMAKKSLYMKSIAFFIIILAIFSTLLVDSVKGALVNDITSGQAACMINDKDTYPDLFILDVRTVSEYNSGHIPNASNIPVEELVARIGEIAIYNNTEIIVYCRSGVRSRQASDILIAQNFTKVYNMLGGFNSWTGVCSATPAGNQIDFLFNVFLVSVFGVIIIIIFKIKFIVKSNKLRK
jgi:rhodanese-related sulfurtransferase